MAKRANGEGNVYKRANGGILRISPRVAYNAEVILPSCPGK